MPRDLDPPLRIDRTRALNRLIGAAERALDLPARTVLSRDTRQAAADLRAVILFIAHHDFGLGLSPLGRMIGRDHTSVMAAIGKVARALDEPHTLRTQEITFLLLRLRPIGDAILRTEEALAAGGPAAALASARDRVVAAQAALAAALAAVDVALAEVQA